MDYAARLNCHHRSSRLFLYYRNRPLLHYRNQLFLRRRNLLLLYQKNRLRLHRVQVATRITCRVFRFIPLT